MSKCLSESVEAQSKKAFSFIYMPRSQAECNEREDFMVLQDFQNLVVSMELIYL